MGITATALSAPVSVDEVTLTKSEAGVISAKTGNGANQAVILDGTGKMPAIDGSALTNMPVINYPAISLPLGTHTGASIASSTWEAAPTGTVRGDLMVATNDYVTWNIYLIAGTYTISMYRTKCQSNLGGIDFLFDAAVVGQISTQNGTDLYNTVGTITEISLAASGYITVKARGATIGGQPNGRLSDVLIMRTA